MITAIWPWTRPVAAVDRALHRLRFYPGFCNVCGRLTVFKVHDANFREDVKCARCGSVNRYRQMVAVLLREIFSRKTRRFGAVRDIPKRVALWNAEATRALHRSLAAHLGETYVCSEFVAPSLKSGERVDGVLHVDMQKTHFADGSLDYILSSDVVEHIPFYRQALKETHRILKIGGAHIFTAPFYQHRASIERRSVMHPDGRVEHLRRPWYHGDPLRPEGVLCYNVFAPELLVELEAAGFEAELLILHDPLLGILGANGLVIVARKTERPSHQLDLIFPDDPVAATPA